MKIFSKTTGQGEDIVIIHGLCSTHVEVQPLVDALAKSYRVTVTDSPGIGSSPWSASTSSVHDIADQLLSVLPAKAIYIGSSFGGQIILSIAARHPERVKQIICSASTPQFPGSKDWVGLSNTLEAMLYEEFKTRGIEAVVWDIYENEFSKINPKTPIYDRLKQSFPNRGAVPFETVCKTMAICDATNLREELKAITCPVDFIMGTDDGAVPVGAYKAIQALNPKYVRIHIIPGAQHLPYLTHPTEFNAALCEILNRGLSKE